MPFIMHYVIKCDIIHVCALCRCREMALARCLIFRKSLIWFSAFAERKGKKGEKRTNNGQNNLIRTEFLERCTVIKRARVCVRNRE